ncbi:S8 family serine peptidase [bacterium]|nr:S8 family serine peptidase [bacterium]
MHPLFALLLLSTPTIIVQNPSGQSVEVAAQRLVVGWEANTLFTASPNETTLFFGSGGERITTIELPTGVDLHQERERLSALEGVAWVEYDNLNRLHALPNDPTWGDQWTLQVMNMETAWDIETGDSSIVVAVLDSGFDLTNTGIGYAAWDPATELIDFGNNDGDPTWTTASLCNPGAFHGTATAGLIASNGNDGQGITGVGWGLNVLPVKVMRDSDCGIWDSDWTAALNWIVDNRPDVRVVNISFGSEGTGSLQSAAIEKAWNGGVLVVASAGNCGDPATWQDNGCTTLNPLFFPASLDHVIAVASTDEDDGRSLFSEHGNWIDLSAPGGFSSPIGKPMPVCGLSPGAPGWGPIATDITGSDGYNTGGSGPGSLSQACDPSGGRYYSFFGTSASAPYLSGLAALVLSKTPSLTNQEVWDRLLGTARIPAGWNSSEMGVGVADG